MKNAARSAPESPVFVSALLTALERGQGAPRRADAIQWRGWLDGAQRRGDFLQAERSWSGVDAWLSERDSTTREELTEFVRASDILIQEIVLDDYSSNMITDTFAAAGYKIEQDGVGEERTTYYTDPAGEDIEFHELPISLREVVLRNTNSNGDPIGGTRYSQHQLPGGRNYRELLLTLPVVRPAAAQYEIKEEGDKFRVYPAGAADWVSQHASNEQAKGSIAGRMQRDEMAAAGRNDYESRHFNVPNILVHVRFNERADADGKRVLFLEEVQSDWHQSGRKKGYAGDLATATEGWTAEQEGGDSIWTVLDPSGKVQGRSTASTAKQAISEYARSGDLDRVPDAPFKTTWPMLAMKRMIRYAAENGFDRIAWATGAQQAARYQLSKHVDAVSIGKIGGGGWQVVGRKEGGVIIDTNVVSDEALAGAVGKDLAEKATALGGGTFSGTDLVLGGGGMQAFYDQILPNEVNKFAKRFGGRVGQATLGTAIAVKVSDDLYGWVVQYGDGHQREVRFTEEAAQRRMMKINDAGYSGVVHSLELTPAMQDAALGGLPLFKRNAPGGAGAEREEEDERPAVRF